LECWKIGRKRGSTKISIFFFDGLELTWHNGGRTERMRLHSQVGEGAVHRVVPRSDIELVISDYRFYRNRGMRLITESAMVELHFCLQGTREVSVAGSRYSFEPGQCGLQFVDRADVQFEFAGEQPYVMLGIGIPVPTFHHFMEQTGGTRSCFAAPLERLFCIFANESR